MLTDYVVITGGIVDIPEDMSVGMEGGMEEPAQVASWSKP